MSLTIAESDVSASEAAWKRALAENRIEDPAAFAAFMLGKTSRTFALNIQVLPPGLRRQILLAYLFCRMADTLEDDGALEADAKISLLHSFRRLFTPGSGDVPDRAGAGSMGWENRLATFRARLPSEWEASERWDHLLVYHCHWIFPQLLDFRDAVIGAISKCVDEMCSGMADFTRKHSQSGSGILTESLEDLDRYCYYVAGTVGNLLCDLFALHSPLIGKKRAQALRALSVSFGLGLQLTNILKDIREDGQRNVSFIPRSLLEEEGLSPSDFLSPDSGSGAARIMTRLIRKAQSHLEDALAYTCLLPRFEPRLRLFCLWPLFMAVESLVLMAANPGGFKGQSKIKISRKQVKRIVAKTSAACWSDTWIRAMFRGSIRRLEEGLASRAEAAPIRSLREIRVRPAGGLP